MRIRRALALLPFLGLVACENGGTNASFNAPKRAEGTTPATAQLQYLLTTDATYFSLARFGDNLIAYARSGARNAIVVIDPDGNDIESREVEDLSWGLSADPIAGSVAYFNKSGLNYLESVSGTGWSVTLPSTLHLHTNAVYGSDVVIAGQADEPTSIGCTSDAHGVFLARYRSERCVEIWSPVGIGTRPAELEDYAMTISAMEFAPDGSLALGGWFNRKMTAADQVFNSAGGDDMFLTVLEPDGSSRFTRVAGDSSTDRISSLAWSADGAKLFIGGLSYSEMDFGDGERRNGDGGSFISSFDANSGAHLWSVALQGPVAPNALRMGGVDEDRVLVSVPSCKAKELTVSLPSDGTGDRTCIGTFDANTGGKLYMMEVGPTLWNTMVLAGNGGFWLATSFEGRPDFGNGKLQGGHEVFARYIFR